MGVASFSRRLSSRASAHGGTTSPAPVTRSKAHTSLDTARRDQGGGCRRIHQVTTTATGAAMAQSTSALGVNRPLGTTNTRRSRALAASAATRVSRSDVQGHRLPVELVHERRPRGGEEPAEDARENPEQPERPAARRTRQRLRAQQDHKRAGDHREPQEEPQHHDHVRLQPPEKDHAGRDPHHRACGRRSQDAPVDRPARAARATAALTSDRTVATFATSASDAMSSRLQRPSRISAMAKPVMLWAHEATTTQKMNAASCQAVMGKGEGMRPAIREDESAAQRRRWRPLRGAPAGPAPCAASRPSWRSRSAPRAGRSRRRRTPTAGWPPRRSRA